MQAASRTPGSLTKADAAPKVLVILPVYNGAQYLEACLDSLVSQTHANLEVVVIDDGSVDGSAAIAAAYPDQRVRLIRHETNQGIVASMNDGLEIASNDPEADYVARMDADDICAPTRLEMQVAALERDQSADLCSLGCAFFGARAGKMIPPASHVATRTALIFSAAIVGPTVMLRMQAVRRLKIRCPEIESAEDYAMWVALIDKIRFISLQTVGYHYRSHPGQESAARRDIQLRATRAIRRTILQSWLGLRLSSAEEMSLERACLPHMIKTADEVLDALRLIRLIGDAAPNVDLPGLREESLRRRRVVISRSPSSAVLMAMWRSPAAFRAHDLAVVAYRAMKRKIGIASAH